MRAWSACGRLSNIYPTVRYKWRHLYGILPPLSYVLRILASFRKRSLWLTATIPHVHRKRAPDGHPERAPAHGKNKIHALNDWTIYDYSFEKRAIKKTACLQTFQYLDFSNRQTQRSRDRKRSSPVHSKNEIQVRMHLK